MRRSGSNRTFIETEERMEPCAENTSELVRNSRLYREFLAERDEVLRHKWLESEKAGCDIGFERALIDWMVKHRSAWRRHREQLIASETSP
jgi:hypothetical protein